MAKARLLNYAGDWTYLRENPIHQLTTSRLPIDADTWAEAEPRGDKARKITLHTEYTEPVYGEDDFEMSVDIRFVGRFEKSGGDWSGAIRRVHIFDDGDLAATIRVRGNVDLDEVHGETYSGVIWNTLAMDGFRGALSHDHDYFRASSGDDVIRGRRGADTISGYDGNDKLIGKLGHDTLLGFNGDDRLIGNRGRDDLNGLAGDDILKGGRGRDTFRGEMSLGQDTWTGGGGRDLFEVGYFDEGRFGATVTDFKLRQRDKVDLRSDSAFHFYEIDEIRYIGDAEFTGEDGDYEIRMENGIVEIDNNGDGEADLGIELEGHDSFAVGRTGWLVLPDGFDFA